jgi:calcineurin-like phosphoesterase family protein
MKYFFTADEHYGHRNILSYCKRPFKSLDHMDRAPINNHNKVVSSKDTVYHLGDFTLSKYPGEIQEYIKQLNGTHIFITGSHDKWMKNKVYLIEEKINGVQIVMCHYAMRVWPGSHYNSWQLYGHSHGHLPGVGKQLDVGVDTHHFCPYSFDEIKTILDKKEDNFNKIKDSP